MNTKEHVEVLINAGVNVDVQAMISTYVKYLIDALFKPHLELGQIRDHVRCQEFDINEEPINWGDLKVNEVYAYEDGYKVVIDEAAPDACPTFCAYIEKYMKAWGWIVYVETEW